MSQEIIQTTKALIALSGGPPLETIWTCSCGVKYCFLKELKQDSMLGDSDCVRDFKCESCGVSGYFYIFIIESKKLRVLFIQTSI